MRQLKKRCGQSSLEYAILIAVVVAGLIAMQTYVKRGVQGRLRAGADDIGGQYSPGLVTSTYTTTSGQSSTETSVGGMTTTEIHSQIRSRKGHEEVAPLDQEVWR